jgi:transcription elongation factor GreA
MPASQPIGESITREGLAALKEELYELETNGRRAISQRILAARELGDLKENAEYQAHLETRIKRLRQRLRNAVVEDTQTDHPSFTFGRTAEVRDEDTGTVYTWTIVGSTEANRAEGKLSAESPVGKALLGGEPGDLVEVETPRGQRRLRIEKLVS